MNIIHKLAIVFLLLGLTGCDSFPKTKYSLGSEASFSANKAKIDLCNYLSVISKQAGLIEQKAKRNKTICYFADDEYLSLVVGARHTEGTIVVDVQAINRDKEYQQLKSQVENMLSSQYPFYRLANE